MFSAEVGSWGLYMQLQGIEFMPEQEGVQEEGYAENNNDDNGVKAQSMLPEHFNDL